MGYVRVLHCTVRCILLTIVTRLHQWSDHHGEPLFPKELPFLSPSNRDPIMTWTPVIPLLLCLAGSTFRTFAVIGAF